MTLLTMSINLAIVPNGHDPAQAGWWAHAALMRLLAAEAPGIFSRLHEPGTRYRPFSLAVMPGDAREMNLKLSLMASDAEDLASGLVQALEKRHYLRLGQLSAQLASIKLGYAGLGVTTWSELMQATPAHWIQLRFLTATAVMKRTVSGDRVSSMLPDPVDIFGGLKRRWQALGGPAFSERLDLYLESRHLEISDIALGGASFGTPERWQVGCVGRVEYVAKQRDEYCQTALAALARFAQYAGVGYQTARGMGAVQAWLRNK